MTVTVPLQIVKHSECDEDDFFTLSASGVTHFQSGKADFTQLVRCPALPRRRGPTRDPLQNDPAGAEW